jgi:penicillin-binding protein 2
MSIGQGDVLVTSLQMAMVTAAVANGGTLWQPHLLLQATDANGTTLRKGVPSGKNVGVTAANLALIRRGMREVVTRGTGRGSALPNVDVAGKTGSAEDVHHGLPHAWWVCFAPYEKPTIAIAVMVENSGHGADNAAPIAKKILEAAFPLPEKTPAAKR